jgi:hypothetical protein
VKGACRVRVAERSAVCDRAQGRVGVVSRLGDPGECGKERRRVRIGGGGGGQFGEHSVPAQHVLLRSASRHRWRQVLADVRTGVDARLGGMPACVYDSRVRIQQRVDIARRDGREFAGEASRGQSGIVTYVVAVEVHGGSVKLAVCGQDFCEALVPASDFVDDGQQAVHFREDAAGCGGVGDDCLSGTPIIA